MMAMMTKAQASHGAEAIGQIAEALRKTDPKGPIDWLMAYCDSALGQRIGFRNPRYEPWRRNGASN